MPGRRRRIAICEDSRPFAEALTNLLEREGEFEVVGRYQTGEGLVDALDGLDADVVTMDLEVPGMGGLRTIKSIMRDRPLPILVISSHSDERSMVATEALAAGALEVVHKGAMTINDPDARWAAAFRSRIKLLASIRLERQVPAGRIAPPHYPRTEADHPVRGVVIGASAGGPPALETVLGALPADYPVPVMVVQHIADGFLPGLVDWLACRVSLPVDIAEEGVTAEPGVWFPPENNHLILGGGGRFRFDAEWGLANHRPSVDKLFASAAEVLGGGAVAVVLTGMGRDGCRGVEAIRSAGGRAVAQSETTSAVFGMPGAAAESGADLVALEDIGPMLSSMRTDLVHR